MLGIAFFALNLSSCKKETEDLKLEDLSSYIPLKTGNYITYRLDSTVFTNFGRDTEIHSYQEKHVVDALFTDNLGRPAYRIFQFIRDTNGTGPWKPSGSYSVTVQPQTIEVNENNLRTIKLAAPLKLDFSWKGNRYLPTEPYSSLYTFSNDDYMEDWDFMYSAKDETLVLKNHVVDSVLTVTSVNESLNVPMTSTAAIAYINYSVDKYGKSIGLVYQEMEMWEYQPNPSGPTGYKTGFGIKRSMIDHN